MKTLKTFDRFLNEEINTKMNVDKLVSMFEKTKWERHKDPRQLPYYTSKEFPSVAIVVDHQETQQNNETMFNSRVILRIKKSPFDKMQEKVIFQNTSNSEKEYKKFIEFLN